MSDRAAIGLALAVCAGAWWSPNLPVWVVIVALVLIAGAIVRRRVALLIGASALLAAALGSLAWSGLRPPERPVTVEREVTLLSDPVDVRGALRVDVRIGRRRAEAWARGKPAAALRDRLAGERVAVSGRLVSPSPRARDWLARRHVAARLQVGEVRAWRQGGLVSRVANGARRTLVAGARPLDDRQRPLFSGFVLGDDRGQRDEVASDFRAAGLTHLLVVSGQNVAFVLVVARPLVARLGLRGRWVATMLLLGFIIVITRAEPSVLRATAMAAISATAVERGRPASRLRVLALAVAAVVLLDPLLVHVMGFRLSVGASLGIVVLAGPIAARLPGPRWTAELVAVTLAAQVGVAPVIIPAFDGLPVASLPANLLAVPAAGPLMMWGLAGGLAAGVLGPPFDGVLHVPTSLLLHWVAGVAEWAAGLPLGRIGLPHLLGLVALASITWVSRPGILRQGAARAMVAPVGAGLMALIVGAPTLWPPSTVLTGVEPARGATLWRDSGGAVVLVVDRPDPLRLLDGLRSRGVRRVDLVVARHGSGATSDAIAVVRRRVPVRAVLAPEGHEIRDAIVIVAPSVVAVGEVEVTFPASDQDLAGAGETAPDVRLKSSRPGRRRG